jgi:shikimate dehydrogenase
MTIRLFLIIGDPVEHSRSPQMHEAGYRALGISSQYRFAAARVTKEGLGQALAAMKTLQISGAACTMPLKEILLDAVDESTPEANAIGAVNTLTFSESGIIGHNTDWLGIVRPLAKRRSWSGSRALILGAGGAAAAALYACKKLGISATISNRTDARAEALAKRFSAQVIPWEARLDAASAPLIINTTSLGMGSEENISPLPNFEFTAQHTIFETIYFPEETALIREANARGAQTIRGLEMLLFQGMAQFEHWTGNSAPEAAMREGLLYR